MSGKGNSPAALSLTRIDMQGNNSNAQMQTIKPTGARAKKLLMLPFEREDKKKSFDSHFCSVLP